MRTVITETESTKAGIRVTVVRIVGLVTIIRTRNRDDFVALDAASQPPFGSREPSAAIQFHGSIVFDRALAVSLIIADVVRILGMADQPTEDRAGSGADDGSSPGIARRVADECADAAA